MAKKLAVIDDNTELQKTAERIISLKDATNFDLPATRGKALTGEKLDKWLETKEDQASINMVERGFGYALKKRELGHGLFTVWAKESGRSQSSVSEAIKIAHLLIELSAANSGRALSLPQRKLKVLAGAPASLIDDLFDNDELNDDMSREQMRDIIRLEKKNADLSTKLDTAVLKNNQLKDQLKNKGSDSRFPEYVDTARHESASLTYRMELNIDDLTVLYNDLRQQEDLLTKVTPENKIELHVAYASLYHNLNGAVAKASQLLMFMRDELDPDDTTSMIDHACIFDKKEADAAIKTKQILQLEHEHDKLKREQTQKTGKPKSRKKKAK